MQLLSVHITTGAAKSCFLHMTLVVWNFRDAHWKVVKFLEPSIDLFKIKQK